MDILRRFCIFFIFLIVFTEATSSNYNETSEDRQSRATGRIVKLYSGPKPEPILCAGEGFQKDPYNCAVFYRCMKSGNGKYTVFRFQCGPGTVYDPETEICNHPRSTKRSECGGFLVPTEDTTHINEIENMHQEIPSPIITNRPSYISPSTIKTTTMITSRYPTSSYPTHSTTKREVSTPPSSPYPWGSTISNVYIDNGVTAYPLKPTPVTARPVTTLNIPHSNSRDNICTSDGFMGDSENCRKFYRCVANQRGGYTRYEFSCTETTIWDEDNQICNHVWAVKRSRCGRGIDRITSTNIISTTEKIPYQGYDNINQNAGDKSNTIQQQLQVSYGSKVTQTQTQISNGPVVQNQTQIHYGDRINPTKNNKSHQNQTQVSHGSAVSQSQTQIDYGNKGIQTQVQIDHSNKASQSQAQIHESSTKSTSTEHVNNEITNAPFNNECTESGFMGDGNDCQKFYRCIENGRGGYTKYEFSCSEGTVWDQNIKACNHAWAVKDCGSKMSSKPNTSTIISSSHQTTPSQQLTTSITTTSTEYYQVSPESQNNEDNGYQSPIPMPTSSITSTTTAPSAIDVSKNDGKCTSSGFMGDDNDCNIFYRCVENGNGGYVKHQFKCGEGTVWDPEISACNHAWAVKKCGGNSSPDIIKIETTTKKATTSSSIHQSSTVTHSTVSTLNYPTVPVPADPAGNDDDDGYQNPPKIPASSTSSSTMSTTTIGSSKGGDCTSSGFIGDNNDCKIFYRCVENGNGGYVKYEFKCGEGTVWDPEIEACNHAWAVEKCGGSSATDINKIETSTNKLTTSSVYQSSTITTHSTTSIDNYPTMPSSPTMTDDDDFGYQKPQQMPTSSTSIPILSTSLGGSNTGQCTTSGFMGDDNDCKIFYRCVENGNGGYVKHEFKCGEGTVWDPEIEACNHAWAVKKCGGSQSHETTTKQVTMSIVPASSTNAAQLTTQSSSIDYDNDNDAGYGPSNNDISTTIAPPKQPSNVNQHHIVCTSSGFIGDKHDCKKFYRCVDNGEGGYISYEFTCSEGTAWDPKIDACNHEWAVENCGGGSTVSNVPDTISSSTEWTNNISTSTYRTTTTINTESTSTDTNDCTQDGYMKDSKNCKKFYRCVDNGKGSFTKYEYTCGEGTLWDQEIEACNHAWVVTTCVSNMTSPEEHATTSEYYPPINDETDNVYPSDTDINNNNNQITSSTTEASKDSNQSSSCISSGFIGDKNNCKKFYRCVDDGNGGFTRYEFNCGEGTVWDQSIEACNHAWAVKECGALGNNTTEIPVASTTSTTVASSTSISQEYPQITEGTSNPIKETNKDCSKEGFISDANNCKVFYRCVDDGKGGFVKYEFSCGEGTFWNQEIASCDHLTSDNECGEKGSSTTSKVPQYEHDETFTDSTSPKDEVYSTKKPSLSSGTCTSEGFYGDKNDCKKFYRCVDNGQGGYTKYDFTCGDGTVWDQDLQTCNHELNKCSSLSSGSTQTTTAHSHGDYTTMQTTTEREDSSSSTSSSATNTEKCVSEGFFADPNDCRKFIRCVKNEKDGFTKHQFTCAEGTVWVQEMLICDHDTGESQCGSQIATTPASSEEHQQTTESTTSNVLGDEQGDHYNNSDNKPSSGNNECLSEGYYGNKYDCRRFYRCVDNGNGGYTRYDFACSEGTAWDDDIQACNHIDQVSSCQGSAQHDEDKTPTTQSTTTSSQDSSTTTSSTTQKTTDSKPSVESTTQNAQKPETCESEGFFGNTQDCKKFYRCVDNGNGGYTKYEFTCAEGTIWDQDITTCNHPGDVVNPSCNSTNDGNMSEGSSPDNSSSGGSSSSTTENTSEGQKQDGTSKKPDNNNNDVNCTKAGFYPNPNDCKKFYRCVDWDGDGSKFSVFHFECGEGTIWDPAVETCNHEESVYPPRNCNSSQSESETQSSTTESTTTTLSDTESATTTTKNTEEPSTSTESTTSTTTEQSEEGTTTKAQESTTEQSEENTTKASEENTTEQPSESTTGKQEESTTEKQGESTTEKQEESTTEKHGENTTEQQDQSTTEKQDESTTEKQGEITTEKEGESTTEKSTESTTESSGDGTTEKSGEVTTEQTIASTTEQSTEKTTEQTGGSTTEQTESTTQEASTENSTTEQLTTEESTSDKSTTEQSTTEQGSTSESGTDTSTNDNKECPETEEDQYLFVCPSSFRRHPKYCNLFYQCDENEETHDLKIAVFTCPNGTIYDESQIKCVEESKAEKQCDGEIAQKLRVKRRNKKDQHDPIEVSKDSYACAAAGYYAFEKDGDCSPSFLKCTKRSKSNKLRAFVYQCPEGYIFWSVSRRCERIDRVKDCRRSVLNSWSKRWEIPVENRNVAWA